MARIKQGILGGFSGKIANVVGTSWKGIAVIKSQPLSVANPKTAAQVAQRTKLSACVAMLQPILSGVIKPLNDRFAGQMSGYNYSLQKSIEAFGADGSFSFPSEFKISRATAKAQLIEGVSVNPATKEVTATWTSDAGTGYALATDKMYLVVFNENTGEIGYSANAIRGHQSAKVVLPESGLTSGDILSVYLAALRADGTIGFAQDYYSHFVNV